MSLRPGPGRPENGNCCGATMTKIDPNILRSLLRYEPETGKLFWLERSEHFFKSSECRTAKHSAASWNARCAGKEAFTRSGRQCAGTLFGKTELAHRIAWAIFYGHWPEAEIDHINGNPRDNRIKNLRDVSRKENCRNTCIPSHNSSGIMGVSWHKRQKKWRAHIKHDGVYRHIGTFADLNDAITARKSAERDLGFHPNHGRIAS